MRFGRGMKWLGGCLVALTVMGCALLLTAGGAPAAVPGTCTWNSGAMADWTTAADWTCVNTADTLPTSGDDVVIDQGAPDVGLTTSTDANARSITQGAGGTLDIETGRTLTVSTSGSSSFAGHFTINGTGVLTLGDSTTWTFSGAVVTDSGTINVNSSLSVTGAASLQGSGVVKVGTNGSIMTNPGALNTVTFVPELDNDGTCIGCAVTVSTGTLKLQNGDAGSTTGNYSVAGGSTLEVDNGTFDSPSVTGLGTFKVSGSSHLTVGSTQTFSPGGLSIGGGGAPTATLNSDVTVATFVNGSGNRDGTGTLTITGTADLSGSGFAFNGGTTTFADTITSVTSGPGFSESGATVNFDAPVSWTTQAEIALGGNPSTLNINSSLDVTNQFHVLGNGSSVLHVGSTGSITTEPTLGDVESLVPVNNEGTVTVHSGTLQLLDGSTGTNSGGYVTDSTGMLEVEGTAAFHSPSITGTGTFYDNGPTVTVGSTDAFSPANLKLGNGGTLTLNRDASIVNLLDSQGGVRDGTGTLRITGTFTSPAAGSLSFNGGTTTVASSASPVTVLGGGFSLSAATLNLDTPVSYEQSTVGLGSGSTMNINSTFSVASSQTIGFNSDSTIHVGSTGTLNLDPGSGNSFTTQTQLANDGTVNILSGTSSAAGFTQTGGTTTVAAGAQLNPAVTLSGGTLKGNGTLQGPVSNTGGTVAPGSSPGTLTITGDYTQGAGGTLAEEIAGTTQGSQFDHLVVGGVLTLGGTLAIDSTGFSPALSDTFKIISGASSRAGTFAAVTGATTATGTYTPQYDTDGVTLNVGAPAAPTNTSAPSISGTPAPGDTLTCNNGGWTGSPTGFTYQWFRDGTPISGATSQTYPVQTADQGHTLTCSVVATNNGGSSSPATSAGLAVPAAPPPTPQAPSNSTAPSISGTPSPTQTLTCNTGSWTGSPTGFTYQWSRDGTPIAGATSQTYTVQAADQGHTLTCTVTASNAGGHSSPATSGGLPVPPAATGTTARCTITSSDKVTLKHQRTHGHASPATGTVTINITCDHATKGKITARLTDKRQHHKTKHYRLATINTQLKDGTTTLKLKLPASAVNDLLHTATETISITLTTNTTRTTTTIGPLHT